MADVKQGQKKLPFMDPRALALVREKGGDNKPATIWGAPLPERASSLPGEGILKVNAKVRALAAMGFDMVNFCIGQPDFDTPKHVRESMVFAIENGKSTYTPPEGLPDTLAAAANYLSKTRGIEVLPENVCIYHGLKTTIRQAIECTTDPGDEIIYPVPGFPTYEVQIIMRGGKPVPAYLRPENKFQLDPDELKAKVTNRTKLFILNSPSNPTGSLFGLDVLGEIAKLAQKWGFRIYSDEIYSQLTYGKPFQSIASLPGMFAGTVIADGLSKSHAAPGHRMAFMAAKDPALIRALRDQAMHSDSCTSSAAQYGIIAACNGSMEETKRMAESYRNRRDLIVPMLNGIEGFDCPMPDGAFYAYVDVTKALGKLGLQNAEQLETLLLEYGVAILADTRFGQKEPGDARHCIRFSYVVPEARIVEGVERVKSVVEGRPVG